ncbi:MAG: FliM/FliN family flagellar motor switch protein [Planctomycetota bacterium]
MASDLRKILDLSVPVIVTIGERRMSVDDVLALGPGAILELEKSNEEPLELRINNKIMGHGSAVKLGENFGIRIEQIDSKADRVEALGGGGSSGA